MSECVLSLDIGGTSTRAAIIDRAGRVHLKYRAATPAAVSADAILQTAVDAGASLLEQAHSDGIRVLACGAASAGHVDRMRNRISYMSDTLPGWTGVALGAALHEAFQLPVSLDNDVNAIALGEARYGAGRDIDYALYVGVGTGIGGAVIWNGALWRGTTWTAGEFGHSVVDWDGERICSCGERGHLEAYAAGPAIARRYSELTGMPLSSLEVIASRAEGEDGVARQVIADGARVLGIGLGGLLNMIDPQALIVGGGVTAVGDLWWEPFEAAIRANRMAGPASVTLLPAQLGDDAGLIGAAWLAFSEHLSAPSKEV